MSEYVARQPIFDRSMDTFGYELVYRSSDGASGRPARRDLCLVADRDLAGGRSLLVTADPRDLVTTLGRPEMLERTVVAIPGSATVNASLMDAARQLEQRGASLALDIEDVSPISPELLQLATYARIDASAASDILRAIAHELESSSVRLIATNVSSDDTRDELETLGFDYFAGSLISLGHESLGDSLPALATSRLLLLRELNRPELDVDGIARAIASDVSLSVKLLTLVNSAALGLRQHVTSVKHAAMMLGLNGIRKWSAVIAIQDLATGKPRELIIQSLIRASFCEAVAQRGPLFERTGELYLLGLFSMIDALLDRPLDVILGQLPLAMDLKEALLGEPNEVARVLDLVTAYESANWAHVDEIAGEFAQHEERVAQAYRQAVASATLLAA